MMSPLLRTTGTGGRRPPGPSSAALAPVLPLHPSDYCPFSSSPVSPSPHCLPPVGWDAPGLSSLLWGTLASAWLQRLATEGPWRPLKGVDPVNRDLDSLWWD